jgi:hypothetical protein
VCCDISRSRNIDGEGDALKRPALVGRLKNDSLDRQAPVRASGRYSRFDSGDRGGFINNALSAIGKRGDAERPAS